MRSMASAVDQLPAAQDVLRKGCGLVDRTDRTGRLALTGPEAKAFLQGQVTNDVEALEPGQGCYATWLTSKGKLQGDLRVLDTGAELLLLCERVALQKLFDMIRTFQVGAALTLHKRTLQTAQLSLVGPRARDVAGAPAAGLGEREHDHVAAAVGGAPARLIATDAGVDVLCAASDGPAVRAALGAAGAVEVPEEAAEVLRVESGRPRFGVDLDETVIPQEAGLNARAVSFTKGCYVGQETVARLYYKGKPNRHLRGLRLSAPAPAGAPLRLGERPVGALGSSVVSPALGPIALALVRREAEPGAVLEVGDGDVRATVVALPFAP
jgi:folate-binding protein YgfZ